MKKRFLIELMLLFTVALLFVPLPTRAMTFDDDVGIVYVMPDDQTSVDVIFITEGLTTVSYDIGQYNEDCKYTDLNVMYTDLNVMLQNSQINDFSTGDVAVNLGLRSASLMTTSINLKQPIRQEFNSQREYRLDIGELYSQVRVTTEHI